MIAGRQTGDECRDAPTLWVHGHDARAVVLRAGRADGLVRVGGEQPPAARALLERDVDRGAVRQKADARSGGLGERATDQVAALVENQDVGRERVRGRELTSDGGTRLVVAPTRQAVP